MADHIHSTLLIPISIRGEAVVMAVPGAKPRTLGAQDPVHVVNEAGGPDVADPLLISQLVLV